MFDLLVSSQLDYSKGAFAQVGQLLVLVVAGQGLLPLGHLPQQEGSDTKE